MPKKADNKPDEEMKEENNDVNIKAEEEKPKHKKEHKKENDPEIQKLLKDFNDQKELFLRTAAEFDNFKKRSEREREALSVYVKGQTIKALLPSVDNLARAVSADKSSPEYIKGVEMTIKGLMDALTGLGLEEINPVNEQFNPEFHEAVMHTDDENAGENTVVEVFQKGYKIGDTVLRHAMVKVAN